MADRSGGQTGIIPARQLPDKSVSLLDTACARVAVSLHATPAEVDDCRKRIEALETELGIIAREQAIGIDIGKREADASQMLSDERVRLAGLDARWSAERTLVDELLALRAKLRDGIRPVEGTGSKLEAAAGQVAASEGMTASDRPAAGDAVARDAERVLNLAQLKSVQDRLSSLQGETPLILPTVDYQAVAAVVGDWTGIPVGRMARNEIETILKVADSLAQRVIGQDHAMAMIAKRIQTSRAGLDNPNKPIGVFMLAGTSGVGDRKSVV